MGIDDTPALARAEATQDNPKKSRIQSLTNGMELPDEQ